MDEEKENCVVAHLSMRSLASPTASLGRPTLSADRIGAALADEEESGAAGAAWLKPGLFVTLVIADQAGGGRHGGSDDERKASRWNPRLQPLSITVRCSQSSWPAYCISPTMAVSGTAAQSDGTLRPVCLTICVEAGQLLISQRSNNALPASHALRRSKI